MKILYALQCTGNGHIARAQEILPVLENYGKVDLLVSGHQSQITLPREPKYAFPGVSLLYDNKGGLSYFKTLFQNNFLQVLKDMKTVPVEEYDLVINDFEPVSAWACKLKKQKSVSLSHQAAMLFPETPKPKKKDWLGQLILKYYAPATHKIGFHFQRYNPHIYLPVIRSEIRKLNPVNEGFYMTYLPSYSDDFLVEKLNKTKVKWKIFSKASSGVYKYGNVKIYPIDQKKFLRAFENCEGILCNAGFETPAEALFLKKKLFVIPIKNQYEQYCNQVALKEMDVASSDDFNMRKILEWIDSETRVEAEYPDEFDEIIRLVLNLFHPHTLLKTE